jgi:hypothetical protein
MVRDLPDHLLPEELQTAAARLRASADPGDPLALDELKRTVMARSGRRDRRLVPMKARVATILTILGLAGGTGGALAIAATGGSHGSKGAADTQYKPGKGCGDKNHTHTGPPGNPDNTSCP